MMIAATKTKSKRTLAGLVAMLRKTARLFIDKRLYIYLLLDTLLLGSLYVPIAAFGDYVKTKSTYLNSLNLQGLMQQGSAEALNALNEVKYFLIIFLVILIIIIISALVLYSLLQGMIWADIKKEKISGLGRWIPYNLVIIIPLLLVFLILAIVNLLLGWIISLMPQAISSPVQNFALLALFSMFVLIINIFYKKYQEKKLMWASIGEALQDFYKNIGRIMIISALSSLMLWTVGLVIYPIQLISGWPSPILYVLSMPLYLLVVGLLRLVVGEGIYRAHHPQKPL